MWADDSEASTAEAEIACCDMHDLERVSASSVSTAVHRQFWIGETHAADSKLEPVVVIVGFSTLALAGLPCFRRASGCCDLF